MSDKLSMQLTEAGTVQTVMLQNGSEKVVKRISAALVLLADGIEEISEMGDKDLEGKATLGFANIIRMCGEELHSLIVEREDELQKLTLGKMVKPKAAASK